MDGTATYHQQRDVRHGRPVSLLNHHDGARVRRSDHAGGQLGQDGARLCQHEHALVVQKAIDRIDVLQAGGAIFRNGLRDRAAVDAVRGIGDDEMAVAVLVKVHVVHQAANVLVRQRVRRFLKKALHVRDHPDNPG